MNPRHLVVLAIAIGHHLTPSAYRFIGERQGWMPVLLHYLLQLTSLSTLPVVAVAKDDPKLPGRSSSDKIKVNHGEDIRDP